MSDDEAVAQGPHGVSKDVPADCLHDVLRELRTVTLDPGPLLFCINPHVGDGFATELVLADPGLDVCQLSARGQGDEQHAVPDREVYAADLRGDTHLDRGLYGFIDLPPVIHDVRI